MRAGLWYPPDVLVNMGMLSETGVIVWPWGMINNLVYNGARVVTTLGDRLAKTLGDNLPEQRDGPVVIPPWVDVDNIRSLTSSQRPLVEPFNPENKKVVLYSGNMGISHGIDSILAAAKLLQDRDDILFVFISSGEKWQNARNFGEHHG